MRRTIRPRSKRGSEMGIKALVYLVITVVSLVIAVALFVKVYNAFIGVTPVDQDMEALAKTMSEMAGQQDPYIQKNMLLRVDQNWITGFDKTDHALTFRPIGQSSSITLDRQPSCQGVVCLCSVDSSGQVQKCVNINEPQGKSITLLSDYTGYRTGLPDTKTGVPAPANLPQTSTPFVVNAKLVHFHDAITTAQDASANAVIPVVIEKRTVNNNVIFTIMPDSRYARNRWFMLDACSSNCQFASKTVSDSVSSCLSSTPYDCITSSGTNEDSNYCVVGDRLASGKDSCSAATIPRCQNGDQIREPCICGSQIVIWGLCSQSIYTPVSCDAIQSCQDYCTRTVTVSRPDANPDLAATSVQQNIDSCTTSQEITCRNDPCHVATGPQGSCAVSKQDQDTQGTCAPAQLPAGLSQEQTLLKTAIQNLIDDDRASGYVLVPIDISTIREQTIYGFGTGTLNIQFSSQQPLQQPHQCAGQPCICTVNGAQASCVNVALPDDAQIHFTTDYTGFPQAATLLGAGGATDTPFVLNGYILNGGAQATGTGMYLEKQTTLTTGSAQVGRSIITIIARPKTAYSDNLRLLNAWCGDGSATECQGKKSGERVSDQGQYCIIGQGDACLVQQVLACMPGTTVNGLCSCGNTAIVTGTCTQSGSTSSPPPSGFNLQPGLPS